MAHLNMFLLSCSLCSVCLWVILALYEGVSTCYSGFVRRSFTQQLRGSQEFFLVTEVRLGLGKFEAQARPRLCPCAPKSLWSHTAVLESPPTFHEDFCSLGVKDSSSHTPSQVGAGLELWSSRLFQGLMPFAKWYTKVASDLSMTCLILA